MDWRFILPTSNDEPFGTLRLVSDDTRLAEQILRLGLARRVVTGTGDTESVDAAVIIAGQPADVAKAVATLRPGGILYCEVDRGRKGALRWSPARLRRQLRPAGMVTAAYWRRRQGQRDSLFLPLDAPGAVPWYLRELMDDRRTLRRVGQRVLSALIRQDGRRLGLLARRFSVTGVVGLPDDGRREQGVTPGLLMGSGEVLLPAVLARGEGPWSRVVLLPFGAGDRQPRSVVKLPRTPEHNPATEREQLTLTRIAAQLPSALAATVPEAKGLRAWGGLCVGTETFLPGRPLAFTGTAVHGRPSSISQLDGAVDWLIDMHVGTRDGDVAANAPAAVELLDDSLLRAVRLLRLPLHRDEDALLERYGAARAGANPIPMVLQHCDLTPQNMRWDGSRHSVVDWEAARTGPALCDLFYLLLHWTWPGIPAFGRAHGEVFRRVFMSSQGQPATVAAKQVHRYCAALEVHSGLVEPLLLRTLSQQALDRADRVFDNGGNPTDDTNLYGELIASMVNAAGPVPVWRQT